MQAAKADWTRFDANKILIVLEEADVPGGVLSGSAAAAGTGGGQVRLRYNRTRGLEVAEDGSARRTVPDELAG